MKTREEIQEAFRTIHDNLQLMPDEFCCWKNKSVGNYRFQFSFIRNKEIRNNLAELRICIDYHHSLFKLHKPGLTFAWQHKLVISQLIAGIYEGILFDLFEQLTKPNRKDLTALLAKEKIDRNSLSLKKLNDLFYEIGTYPKRWYEYIDDFYHLRNTIHPKSLNHPRATYTNNYALRRGIDKTLLDLEVFVKNIQSKY